jgi:hypothetical protein
VKWNFITHSCIRYCGGFFVVIAQLLYNIGNSLIEAVNVLGSLFYGVTLGIFLVAFYFRKIGPTAVFISAVIVEIFILSTPYLNQAGIINISFLWLNGIGALGVILLSLALQSFMPGKYIQGTVANQDNASDFT